MRLSVSHYVYIVLYIDGQISVTTLVFPTTKFSSALSVCIDVDRYPHFHRLELAGCLISSKSHHDQSGDNIELLLGICIICGDKGLVGANSIIWLADLWASQGNRKQ